MTKLCPKKSSVKIPCALITHATNFINTPYQQQPPTTIICHFGTNDFETKQESVCIDTFCQTIYNLSRKFASSRILVSLMLPRNDNLNATIQKANQIILRRCSRMSNVCVIEHTNLTESDDSILRDTKHLTRYAVTLFAKNIKDAIHRPGNLRQHASRPNYTPYANHAPSYPAYPNHQQMHNLYQSPLENHRRPNQNQHQTLPPMTSQFMQLPQGLKPETHSQEHIPAQIADTPQATPHMINKHQQNPLNDRIQSSNGKELIAALYNMFCIN